MIPVDEDQHVPIREHDVHLQGESFLKFHSNDLEVHQAGASETKDARPR
jgi:hypothetical protein